MKRTIWSGKGENLESQQTVVPRRKRGSSLSPWDGDQTIARSYSSDWKCGNDKIQTSRKMEERKRRASVGQRLSTISDSKIKSQKKQTGKNGDLTNFCNSHSRLSKGQTFLVFNHLEIQWKWKACLWLMSKKKHHQPWAINRKKKPYIAYPPCCVTFLASSHNLVGLAIDACCRNICQYFTGILD